MQQKTEAINGVKDAGQLTLDPYSYEMLKTLTTVPGQYSEMMLVCNGASGIFRLTVDKFTQVMFSTSGAERSRILTDIDNGIDVIDSINNYIIGDESFDRFKTIKQLIEEMFSQGRNKHEVAKMLKNAITECNSMVN